MAAYESLTAEQKLVVKECVNPLRSVIGELARLCNHALAIDAKWTGNVETIIASLDEGEIVPDESTYQDSEPLTKEQIQSLVGYILAIGSTSTGYATDYHRGLYVRAAGVYEVL
jgi:Uma2 family endonuclease